MDRFSFLFSLGKKGQCHGLYLECSLNGSDIQRQNFWKAIGYWGTIFSGLMSPELCVLLVLPVLRCWNVLLEVVFRFFMSQAKNWSRQVQNIADYHIKVGEKYMLYRASLHQVNVGKEILPIAWESTTGKERRQ